jgi:hypothetical protein
MSSTEGPEPETTAPAFMGMLAELANAEVIPAVDTPEYKQLRYGNEPPTNGKLELLMRLHAYLTEHMGENMTQAQIAVELNTHQPKISDLMNTYPGIFIKQDKTYIAGVMPEAFREAYDKYKNVSGEVTYVQGPTKFEREVNTKLDKLLKIANTNSSRQNVTARPYLDEAIIAKIFDKYRMDIADSTVDYSEYDTTLILATMYRMIRVLDKDVPGAMQVISELFTD